ncbi:Radical SAM domain protein [Sandaracinus amylolyticus]|uniref:Radical SAM domain protein n=1 Tax=Sandaracinus amylolyticus TaxID=927083 RepID=A0A0F6VYZ9_9BACT|nr:Radical SAM domain protein [Sandaracinus amylolyticus]
MDSPWRDPNGTFYSFSYAIEKLRASLRSDPELHDVEVLLLDLCTDDPDAFFEALREFRPTLVGLSTYIWSLDVFTGLVERLRRHDPRVVIVAGGPAARRSVLDLGVYQPLRDRLDAIVPGEGEQTIRDLVRAHREPDWRERVGGLEIPARGLWRRTRNVERPEIDAYASPYQLGQAPLGKTGYIETFRGCPIHCAFCQWGEQKADRVHSSDYLARHLEGLRAADVPNVFFVDAAFNLSPRAFRNLAAAERQVRALRDKIVHGHIYPTHLEEHHLELFDTFAQVQASVGIQSFDEEVLARMQRPFDVDRFERVLKRMRGRLDVDIELIFGLPGDGPESFWRTLERSIELGDTVKIFRCFALPDALLERADTLQIQFDPRSFRITSCEGWDAEQMQREWERVVARASQFARPILNDDWVGFVVDGSRTLRGIPAERTPEVTISRAPVIDVGTRRALGARIGAAASGWNLVGVMEERGGLALELTTPAGAITLHAEPLVEGRRYFAARDRIAYSHRGAVDRTLARELLSVIDGVHADVAPLVARDALE